MNTITQNQEISLIFIEYYQINTGEYHEILLNSDELTLKFH